MRRPGTYVACVCGAEYRREETPLPIKDVGVFECVVCGEVMDRWHGRVVPAFTLLKKPQRKRWHAA